ncbi:hypothetical protein ACHAPO_012087 [Fusarium lateritium]
MLSSTFQKSSKSKDKTPRVAANKSDGTGKKKKIDAKGILRVASKVDFTNKNEAASFEAEYKERFIGRSSAQIILCVLAKKEDLSDDLKWSDEKTKEFLNWILKGYHSLLEFKDKTTKLCPLHLALMQNNTAFVDAILNFPNLININKVLTMEDQSGNALHIALENSHSSFESLVKRCIQFPTMFTAKHPATGNTPLHDCMLVDLDTGEEYEESEEEISSEDEDYAPDTDDGYAHSTTSEEGQAEDFHIRSQQRHTNVKIEQPDGFSIKRTQSVKVPAILECPSERLPFVEMLIQNDHSALYLYNAEKRTPYQERLYQLDKYYDKAASSAKETQDFHDFAGNDPIGSYIRSHCVTNFARNDVTKCLYNTGKEKQIEFDLGGLGRDTISREYLEQLSSHLKFESILKYVALPKLVMEGRPRRSKSNRAPNKSMRGRSDLTEIFQWLRDNGVKKIVKVIVLDDQEPCHADSAIEDALIGFDVEIWDWKRLDLSTEVIRKSTDLVREVSLYSSGNNSVLMGWASTDGLPNTDYFPQGYETPDRLLSYINDFKLKIEGRSNSRITVNDFRDDRNSSYASEFQSRVGDSQSESPWIHCMMRLSTLLKSACDEAQVRLVKVAIVDDGVDVSLEGLQNKIALGQSFCPYANSSEMMTPYFVSSSNHGTSMATLICSLCPMVQLYVARLDQRQTPSSNQRHITADSAAQAVRWATDCGVDIISMSWTIETSMTETPEMRSLQDAIRRASDFGGCIKIGSASNTGDAMSWVKVEKVDYLLPGSNVPFSITEGKTNLHESGSSIATAAASGLAAFLMSSSWLLDDNDNYLKDFNNIKRAFSNLAQGQKFPAVTERLEKLFKRKLARRQNKEEKAMRDLPMEWSDDCQEVLKDIVFAIKDTT